MKKAIALLLLAALLLTGCGSEKSGNDSAAANTDTTDVADTTEAPTNHSDSSVGEDFENKIIAICKEHGVGFSYHADYNRRGLSDPNVIALQATCNTIDGRHDYTCEIKTEYYEDAGLAREAYEQLRDGEDAFEELSDWYLLLDDDVTYAVKSDFYDSLQYCKLYDHYVVYIWAADHGDIATEIMYDIESLIEGL